MPTASEETQNAIEVERRVRKRHLGPNETGLRPALGEALRRLYSLPRLPANPYFFVATALSAHSSHGTGRDVWSVTDEEVMDELEDVTLVDGGNGQTCKLNRFSDAWGLPHVLRATDREGLTDVKTLLQHFPPALYPTVKRQVDDRNPECSYQCLLSLQEGCLHRRKYQGAPARIGLRVDVLVDGPTIAEGLQTFVEYIDNTTEGVAKHSEAHAVRGVLLMPGSSNWGSDSKSARRAQWWSLDKMRTEQRGFDVAVKRATSSHHKVAMECIVRCPVPPQFLDGDYGTAAEVARERNGGAPSSKPTVMHFSVRTYFTFHYRVKTRKGTAPTASHYASLPFESMYTGLFLEQQASSAYNDMYGGAVAPTSPLVLKNNVERMMKIGIAAMRDDDMPRALRMATLILLLRGDLGWHDGDDPPPVGSVEHARERAFADLIRCTNSNAVWLFNVANEAKTLERLFVGSHAVRKTPANAEALTRHVTHLHYRMDDFMKHATRRDHGLEPLREMASDVLVSAIRACERGGRALANDETSARVSLACERALEKAKLLMIVVSLTRSQENQLMRPHMALMQAGAFGLNLILKSEAHGSDVDAAIDAAIEAAMAKKKRHRARRARLKAELQAKGEAKRRGWFSRGSGKRGGGSSSDSSDDETARKSVFATTLFARKKEEVKEEGGLQKHSGIPLVDPRAPPPTEKELDVVWQRVYEVVAAGTCLDTQACERWMRKHRYAPPRFNSAAMLLQYVADARLDETLQQVLVHIMQPPLVRNPFPEAVGRLRAVGHQFDVSFHLSGGDLVAGGAAGGGVKSGTKRFTDGGVATKGVAAASPRIAIVSDDRNRPTFVYAARPPSSDLDRAERKSDARDDATTSDVEVAVFGLYSAVALADPIRCRRLFDELPSLFKPSQWQEGPYMYQRIPGLGGDASFTAGLGPASAESARREARGARASRRRKSRNKNADASARADALGFTCVVEERTKATGPDAWKAAELYGADVVDRLLAMHHDTPWLVHDVVVPRGVLAAAGAAAARRRLEEEERLAKIGELSARLDERPGTAAASELLSRVGSAMSGGMSGGSNLDGANLDDGARDDGLDNDDPNLVPGGGYGGADGGDAGGALGPAPPRVGRGNPTTGVSDPERLELLKRRLEEAEAVLGADYQRPLFSGGAMGQNAMRENDVIRVPWEEVRTNQRDVGRIIARVVAQGGEACAQISVKYRGKYLPVFVNFHFLFERRGGGGLSEDADEERARRQRAARTEAAEKAGDAYAPAAGRDGGLDSWPLDAYTMVFPSRTVALAYSRWHDWKGDPSSAGHTRAVYRCFTEEEARCASERDYLAAIRCRTARALVAQEPAGRVANLASTLMGVPMLTQGLQDNNAMLQHLVGLQDAPEDLLIKLDTRSARSALLEYLDDTERTLTSPSLSYYLGANRVMVKNLTEIRAADARAGGQLDENALELLREVNTWLAVSETCISRGLYRVVAEQDEETRLRKLWRAERAEARAAEKERKRLLEQRLLEHERAPK